MVASREELEGKLNEFQNLQSQLQMLMIQKQQMKLQLEEMNDAEKELKTAKGVVFRSVGTLLIEATRDETENELKERRETMDVRMKTLAKQEEKTREKLEALRRELESAVGAGAG